MKRISMLLLFLFSFAFLFGCTEKITNSYVNENYGDPFDARVIGTIHGVITEQGTGRPMRYVRVTYASNSETRSTYSNDDGYYRCDNLVTGDYQLCFYPMDTTFAVGMSLAIITHDSAFAHPSGRDIYVTRLRNITLWKCNASVEGYVNLRPNGDTTFFSTGAEVSITFMNDILQNVYRTTTTNPYGFYRFTNLPAVNVYGVQVRVEARIVNGVHFAAINTPGGVIQLAYNDTVMAPNIVQIPETLTPLTVINSSFLNRGAIPPNTVLLLDFNRPIADLGQILTDISQVPNVQMPTAIVVENNNTRLRIVSTLTAATNYRLNVRVRGVEDYNVFTQTYTFGTTP